MEFEIYNSHEDLGIVISIKNGYRCKLSREQVDIFLDLNNSYRTAAACIANQDYRNNVIDHICRSLCLSDEEKYFHIGYIYSMINSNRHRNNIFNPSHSGLIDMYSKIAKIEDKKPQLPEDMKDALELTNLAQEYQKDIQNKTLDIQKKKNEYFKKHGTLVEKIGAYININSFAKK